MGRDDQNTCPFCKKAATGQYLPVRDLILEFSCDRCGKYRVTEEALQFLGNERLSPNLFKLSAFTRNRGEIASDIVTIVEEPEAVSRIPGAAIDVVSAMALFPSKISERLDRALQNIERRSNYPGERFRINLQDDYPLFYAENPDACWYIGQALAGCGKTLVLSFRLG